jgi:hypothetical protein
MSSFRVEAYGLLVGILLLQLMTHQDTDKAKNEIHTNITSLLARLTWATCKYIHVGFWLKADSDIVRQIVDEVQHIHALQRKYVEGHQDLTEDKKDYTIPDTYNIAVNDEATIMCFALIQPVCRVILFPHPG